MEIKNYVPAYLTLASAEDAKRDPELNTTHPSIENVIEMREWCNENKK